MKFSDFINKIKTYSVVSFLLPLLAINSCLLLYKFFGNIELYPNFDWDKKKFEVAQNSNDYNYSSYINCPKYKYKSYVVSVDNKILLVTDIDGSYINTEKKKILHKNNKIKSKIYKQGQIINYRCVKNHKYLNLILNNFSFLEKILINAYKNNSAGFTSIKNPYFYGEVSISRTARYFPATLIFKPFIILSAIFLFLYWKNNLNLFNELKNNNVLKKFSKSFFYLGILSCVFLIMHAALLGLDFDSKLFG